MQATSLHAETALLRDGWKQNVRLVFSDGRITAVETGASPQHGDELHKVIVPAMSNLHSHAFQRAMAGMAEVRGPADDSFWSWRTVMYRFALSMTPDHVEAIAAQLFRAWGSFTICITIRMAAPMPISQKWWKGSVLPVPKPGSD